MAEALVALDNAQAAATAAGALPGLFHEFSAPQHLDQWIHPTAPQFIQLIRSFKARFRANNARTPAERGAVDWDQVIADAQAGITADWKVTTNTVTGPFNTWPAKRIPITRGTR